MTAPYAYSFITTWKIKASVNLVWDIIYDSEKWPQWWSCVQQATVIKSGDENNIGMVVQYKWKSFLPYTLVFCMESIKLDKPYYMEGIAYGELTGMGKWHINENNSITTLRCEWNVNTNKHWMNNPGWLLKHIFKWNHHYSMRQGAKGLAKILGAELIHY